MGKVGRPKGGGRTKLTVSLLPDTQSILARVADELKDGMTPNRLVATLVEQATPQFEQMLQALEEQRAGEKAKATERLVGLIAPLKANLAALDEAAISQALEDEPRGTDTVPS